MWRQVEDGRGYVMHHLIDFGDCFGSVWGGSAQAAWRLVRFLPVEAVVRQLMPGYGVLASKPAPPA